MINRKKNLSDYDELMASHCQVIHLQKQKNYGIMVKLAQSYQHHKGWL